MRWRRRPRSGSGASAIASGWRIALDRHKRLSDEQREAVRHVAGPERFAAVVGLAGAGKSTMLAAAKEAWGKGRWVRPRLRRGPRREGGRGVGAVGRHSVAHLGILGAELAARL